MKRRWRTTKEFPWWWLLVFYGIAWCPIFVTLCGLLNGCDYGGCGLNAAGMTDGPLIFLAVWFGGGFLAATLWLARHLWRHRPHRVWEPVTMDLREAHRRGVG